MIRPLRALRRALRTYVVPVALFVALSGALVLTAPCARAQNIGPDDLNLCLCRQIIARELCKSPREFQYVGKTDVKGTYVFKVFYANRPQTFVCLVLPETIRIQGQTGQRAIKLEVPYFLDRETGLASVEFSSPDCPNAAPIECRTKPTPAQERAQDRETFWQRPIPEILQEELQRQSDENATTEEQLAKPYEGTPPAQ